MISAHRMGFQSAFLLPNGSCLRYAAPWDKGNQQEWSRTMERGLFNVQSSRKENHLKVGLWSSQTELHVIAADFDQLPVGFGSFDLLYQYLSCHFKNTALVVRSFSGKVKCFFVVELPQVAEMNTATGFSTLEKLLWNSDYDLFEAIDKSYPALSMSFLTEEIADSLKELKDLPIIEAIEDEQNGSDTGEGVHKSINPPHVYRRFEGKIPIELGKWSLVNHKREQFIRILLSSPGLLEATGFDLPTTKFAKECGVSHTTIQRWIRQFEELDWLFNINNDFVIGKKAKTYTAQGELKKQLVILRANITGGFHELPTVIPDGYWHQTLWKLSYRFRHRPVNEFLTYVRTIPGHEKKNRIRMAENAIKQRKFYLQQK